MRDFRWAHLQPHIAGGENEQPEPEQEALDWGEQEWGTHRYHVNRLVEDSVSLLSMPEKAVVLGAGNHGDVGLPRLSAHFQQVTALDTEDNMLQEWLDSAGGIANSRVRSLTRVDYTRLDQISFYETFEELLAEGKAAGEITDYLRDCAFRVRGLEAMPHLKKTFSLVVSSGVHTQLFYPDALMQFYGYMEKYNENETRQIVEALGYLRNSLISDYNRMLLSLVKPDGRVTVWTDMILLDEDKQWIAEELDRRRNDKERTSFLFEAFGQYGIEAAVLGLKDLHDCLRPEQLLFRSWVGYTDSGKTYLIAGLSGRLRL
ncbi:hypothetical protein [Paenibacillus ehimensis]|uniref:Uncharacterized protein n=1 Tax=Paenibacillus ehimensis TaxID=79264 RepID=A0ABT8V9R4_9BACL|nr:hypothetical protein [Paenibacillus ehimensis]MDO3677762.1 hypothetical protein [Paenibacillus ehimensis]MEC0212398.1 hypothetical protein [Paenibacillus ehimensis]